MVIWKIYGIASLWLQLKNFLRTSSFKVTNNGVFFECFTFNFGEYLRNPSIEEEGATGLNIYFLKLDFHNKNFLSLFVKPLF